MSIVVDVVVVVVVLATVTEHGRPACVRRREGLLAHGVYVCVCWTLAQARGVVL